MSHQLSNLGTLKSIVMSRESLIRFNVAEATNQNEHPFSVSPSMLGDPRAYAGNAWFEPTCQKSPLPHAAPDHQHESDQQADHHGPEPSARAPGRRRVLDHPLAAARAQGCVLTNPMPAVRAGDEIHFIVIAIIAAKVYVRRLGIIEIVQAIPHFRSTNNDQRTTDRAG